jgi:hypothetical protein
MSRQAFKITMINTLKKTGKSGKGQNRLKDGKLGGKGERVGEGARVEK